MIAPRFLLALLLSLAAAATAAAQDPAFQNDFTQDPVGKAPPNIMVIAGAFQVQEEAGQKFLELPGAPLDTFGMLFGPSQPGGTVQARFYGTKQGRKFPTFGLSLGGVGGYRLQVSAGKKALEIFKRDEALASVPFTWESGEWTTLRLRLRKAEAGWVVEGKAWAGAAPEPETWTVQLEQKETPPPGRPAIWGSPYAGTPIRFDDLLLEAPAP